MIQNIKTSLLLAALTALLVTVGYLLGGSSGAYSFLMISVVINLVSFWFSDKIAIGMSKAVPLAKAQAPQAYADIEQLATKMGLPMPKVYVIPSDQPNAFATGRGPSSSAIAITEGLFKSLNRDELRGVIAHELAHIKHRDVLLATIAATIAGTISALVNITMWGGDDRNRNPIATIAILILAPISATIMQLAISRSREYAADAEAAKFTQQPRELANALLKIDSLARQIPMQVNPAFASLYISNPLGVLGGLQSLFSTHPPIGERVRRLEDLA